MRCIYKFMLYIVCIFLFQQGCYCIEEPELKLSCHLATPEDFLNFNASELISENSELKRFNTNPKFILQIKNAKSNERFFIYAKNLTGKISALFEDPVDLNTKLWFSLNGFMQGEPCDIVAMSEDQKRLAKVHVIPRPLETRGKNGRKISLEIGSTDNTMFNLTLTGFNLNEAYTLVSKSGNECIRKDDFYSKNLVIGLMPAVIGKNSGTAIVEIHAKNPDEILTLEYDWGYSEELRNKMKAL